MCRVVTGGVVEPHKGVNVPGVPLPVPVAHREGSRGSRLRARARRRLRRSVLRPLASRRRRPPGEDRAGRVAGLGDREDRAEGGGRGDRRDPRRGRCGDDRARRPRRGGRRGRRAAPAEAHHPRRSRAGKAGDHRDPDARVDGASPGADPRRGFRRRERDPRRNVGGDALRGDRHRRVPGRGGRDDGADRARGRAEPRVPPPAARRRRGADGRPRDVERRLRSRRGARGQGDPRAHLHGPDGLGGRAASPAPADRRVDARRDFAPAHGDRVGRHAARDPRVERRRRSLAATRSRPRARRESWTRATASSSPRAPR